MPETINILSLDGGGIRGVATAMFLSQLEKELGNKLYDKFDLFAGTSTGALIALNIAANKATGENCVQLYRAENAQTIMDKSFWDEHLPMQNQPKYDGKGKKKILKEVFKDKRILDVKKPVLITAYDIILRQIVVFKSKGGFDADYNPKLVEVANATTAAPTYFPTVKSKDDPNRWLVDGGLSANNPSMCALAEALKTHSPDEIKVLSIGTGIQTRGKEKADELGRESQEWGGIGWLTHGLIDHLFAGNTTATDYHCKQILGDNYVRVDGPLEYCKDDLDDVSQGNIDNLKRMGREWFEQFGEDVMGFLDGD
jgi:patatin-like phospholipase/acyl hydrolase